MCSRGQIAIISDSTYIAIPKYKNSTGRYDNLNLTSNPAVNGVITSANKKYVNTIKVSHLFVPVFILPLSLAKAGILLIKIKQLNTEPRKWQPIYSQALITSLFPAATKNNIADIISQRKGAVTANMPALFRSFMLITEYLY